MSVPVEASEAWGTDVVVVVGSVAVAELSTAGDDRFGMVSGSRAVTTTE